MRRSTIRLVLLVACAAGTGFYLAREPWIVYQRQKQEAKRAQAETERLDRERAELMRKKVQLGNSAGRERLARDQGYVKKGEVQIGQ